MRISETHRSRGCVLQSAQSAVNVLKECFGRHRLQTIRYSDLRKYRADRLKEPTPADTARHKRELETDSKAEIRVTRKIATVNRELAKLRRMTSRELRGAVSPLPTPHPGRPGPYKSKTRSNMAKFDMEKWRGKSLTREEFNKLSPVEMAAFLESAGGGRITEGNPTMTRDAFDHLSNEEKWAFVRKGGKLTD